MNEKQPDLNQPLVPENIETPKSLEEELSPEVLEKVMAKVQDIDKKGTAYSIIFRGKPKDLELDLVENVLRNGIKGTKKRNENVYFNIVKRGAPGPGDLTNFYLEIGNSFHMYSGNIAIIFDIQDFIEEDPARTETSKKPESSTFHADDPILSSFGKKMKLGNPDLKIGNPILRNKQPYGDKRAHFDEDGLPKPEQEWGFVLAPSVQPERFSGLIVKLANREGYKEYTMNLISDQKKVYVGKNEFMLPIYDADGNLLWPKTMSYEEVKKFVVERDKNKKEEKNDQQLNVKGSL